jgi:molybdopterin converting factor small subunit
MQVTVKLFAGFRTGRFEAERREYPSGTKVEAIVDELGIRKEEIGVLLVGGRHADLGHAPAPGDTIAIFPLVGGG